MTTHGQGPIEDTGKTYDLAINGDGFFVIQGENGQYLTRNGHFTRDDEGNLMLPGVGQLMGDGGPVYVDEEDSALARMELSTTMRTAPWTRFR